jgi:hypothetical protein
MTKRWQPIDDCGCGSARRLDSDQMPTSTSFGAYWGRSKYYLLATAVVALASLWLSWRTRNSLPAALAGALLTLLGIPLTFSRLLRRGAAGSNDPEPPLTHPQKPGERGVQFNTDTMWSQVRGIFENFDVINGIILLEVGTLLWGIAAPIMSSIWSHG